jgi:hypothetical protein
VQNIFNKSVEPDIIRNKIFLLIRINAPGDGVEIVFLILLRMAETDQRNIFGKRQEFFPVFTEAGNNKVC